MKRLALQVLPFLVLFAALPAVAQLATCYDCRGPVSGPGWRDCVDISNSPGQHGYTQCQTYWYWDIEGFNQGCDLSGSSCAGQSTCQPGSMCEIPRAKELFDQNLRHELFLAKMLGANRAAEIIAQIDGLTSGPRTPAGILTSESRRNALLREEVAVVMGRPASRERGDRPEREAPTFLRLYTGEPIHEGAKELK